MCGRFSLYAYKMTKEEFEERFGFPLPEDIEYPPSYNIGPYQNIPVLHSDSQNQTKMTLMYWQLIPSFLKEFKSTHKMINTTVESFDKNKYKQDLLKNNRCLIPANNFFECLLSTNQPDTSR